MVEEPPEESPLEIPEGVWPADPVILDFRPPEL